MRIIDKMVCVDGFVMSVQASDTHYCTPRDFQDKPYDAYEVGFPSQKEEALMPYIDYGDDSPTTAVYGYVPRKIILAIAEKHGGIAPGYKWPEEVEPKVIC